MENQTGNGRVHGAAILFVPNYQSPLAVRIKCYNPDHYSALAPSDIIELGDRWPLFFLPTGSSIFARSFYVIEFNVKQHEDRKSMTGKIGATRDISPKSLNTGGGGGGGVPNC